MGEKIRDIQRIKIGNSSLMIELNEGYSASQGRLIHVQNKKFRYLLTEMDFYHFSSMILRAWAEFENIKKMPIKIKQEEEFKERKPVTSNMDNYVKDLAFQLYSLKIDYRILDVQEGLLTIIINPKDFTKAKTFFRQQNAKMLPHPLGLKNGYRFLYQMEPFLLYENGDKLVEIFCQLPCASLTPKTWIPLDRSIQHILWEKEDVNDSVSLCNDSCKYIFHLCWAIFHNLGFSPFERAFLESKKDLLDSKQLCEMFPFVFFNFSPLLVDYLKDSNYDRIIPAYYSFTNY